MRIVLDTLSCFDSYVYRWECQSELIHITENNQQTITQYLYPLSLNKDYEEIIKEALQAS